MPSIFADLAELLAALARVFSDPDVQSAGDNLVSAFRVAVDREPSFSASVSARVTQHELPTSQE